MYKCIFCGRMYNDILKLNFHIIRHNLSKEDYEKYHKVHYNFSNMEKINVLHSNITSKILTNLYIKKQKSQYTKIKFQVYKFLKALNYSKEILNKINETTNYFELSYLIQRKCIKYSDEIHEKFNLILAQKRKTSSANNKLQGLFDKTVSSIKPISTPMGNKR